MAHWLHAFLLIMGGSITSICMGYIFTYGQNKVNFFLYIPRTLCKIGSHCGIGLPLPFVMHSRFLGVILIWLSGLVIKNVGIIFLFQVMRKNLGTQVNNFLKYLTPIRIKILLNMLVGLHGIICDKDMSMFKIGLIAFMA